jgi:anti-sigma factor RsiW
MTFGNFENNGAVPPMNSSEELDWLMSLALDDALDEGEAARLDALLAEVPAHHERWAVWQSVDAEFHQAPFAVPSVDFAAKFEQRLAFAERQRRLRTGFIFGMAAVVLWISALGGTVTLGALMWSNQNLWVGGLVHNLPIGGRHWDSFSRCC